MKPQREVNITGRKHIGKENKREGKAMVYEER